MGLPTRVELPSEVREEVEELAQLFSATTEEEERYICYVLASKERETALPPLMPCDYLRPLSPPPPDAVTHARALGQAKLITSQARQALAYRWPNPHVSPAAHLERMEELRNALEAEARCALSSPNTWREGLRLTCEEAELDLSCRSVALGMVRPTLWRRKRLRLLREAMATARTRSEQAREQYHEELRRADAEDDSEIQALPPL